MMPAEEQLGTEGSQVTPTQEASSAIAETNAQADASLNSTKGSVGVVKKQPRQKSIDRFITVSWSAQREPVDDIVWCEAEQEGAWTVVRSVEIVRTRREVLERLVETERGLVGLDFGFSFPATFMNFLKEHEHVAGWRSLIKHVREDLKKNVEDGLRTWIERIGKYREAHLEPNPYPIRTWERQRNGSRIARERAPELYEQQSLAERFRRAEHALRRAAESELSSTLHIAYNKLTSRYEFSDVNLRGKKAMLGMSMLEQLIEARPDVAIWPFGKPAGLTVVEIFPWLFRRDKTMSPEEARTWLAAEEDSGTDIPSSACDLIARNPEAQRMFFALMGMIRTESRIERTIRPLRDYPEAFYHDESVQQEGWLYGVGYKSAEQREAMKERDANSSKKPGKSPGKDRSERRNGKGDRPKQGDAHQELPADIVDHNGSSDGAPTEPFTLDVEPTNMTIASVDAPIVQSSNVEATRSTDEVSTSE
jgi:hypothetical protein